jgi:hypothetical protein
VPTETPQTAPTLEDYLDLFQSIADLGLEVVVIGGCAVGAYARLIGETVVSTDLDLLVTQNALETVVADGAAIGARVEKLPVPRAVPVAVLTWRSHEINLLTGSIGLPPPDVEARAAREFPLRRGSQESVVLIADPYDLLRNKLAVNRAKDQAHIELLRRFLDEEVVHAFVHEHEPRARLAPAERLLEVLGAAALDESLAARLVPLARTPADFRFLAHRVPTEALGQQLARRITSDDAARTVERIMRARGWLD